MDNWMEQWKLRQCNTVKDLIAKLQKCNPDAIIIVSEKPGRGAAQCVVYEGFTDADGIYLSDEQNEENNIPAIEITADL